MAIKKLCTFPSNIHALPHWKSVLQCCANCKSIVIPVKESNRDDNFFTTILFFVYQLASCHEVHGKFLFEEKNMFIVYNISNNSDKEKIVHTKRTCFNRDTDFTIS